ncbi:MAG: phosphomannomutase/phosphoglucomutase [Planctomycetes bacterium]|nr:phosphomannomutase/phosphoglucomutase [Planctomycetota bacterium]
MGIFKAYDIRGVVPTELDAALAKKIGNAFARLLKAKTLVVGQDMRTHSPALADAVSQGMRDAGANVIRLGLAETPMAYYAIGSLPCDGGLCVTASHNPGQYNGMKLCREGAKPVSKDTGIAELERMCAAPYPAPVAKPGKEEKRELLAEYAAHVAKFAKLGREVSVAIDAANGMGGYTLPAVLERVPKIRAHTLYLEPDGTFPNHEANPLIEANLVDLKQLVKAKKAELGVAFDGDADRCCFVDEQGDTAGADLITALLAPVFLKRFPKTAVVYDLRSSWAVKEEILEAGGVPVRDRVGHSFMKATMRQRGAMFGGELSGHFYFAENFTADSGMIAMMSVLSLLTAPESRGKSLSQLLQKVRRYHSTGEINFHVEDKPAMIAALKQRYASGRQDELDGITVEFGELGKEAWWWFNVRPSNTEPLLRMIVEASSARLRDQKKAELIALLGTPE